jgi:hypothetical protein
MCEISNKKNGKQLSSISVSNEMFARFSWPFLLLLITYGSSVLNRPWVQQFGEKLGNSMERPEGDVIRDRAVD